MTIEAMNNVATAPSGFAGAAGFVGAASCTSPRSTLDSPNAVNSNTTPDITNGSRGS